jgi:transcriptional antiterminator
MNSPSNRVFSGYKDIANYFGVSRRTLYRHIKSLPIARLGGKIVILESDLLKLIQVKTYKSLKKRISVRKTMLPPLTGKKD